MSDKGKYFVTIDSAEGPFESAKDAEDFANQLLSTKAKGRKALVVKVERELQGTWK